MYICVLQTSIRSTTFCSPKLQSVVLYTMCDYSNQLHPDRNEMQIQLFHKWAALLRFGRGVMGEGGGSSLMYRNLILEVVWGLLAHEDWGPQSLVIPCDFNCLLRIMAEDEDTLIFSLSPIIQLFYFHQQWNYLYHYWYISPWSCWFKSNHMYLSQWVTFIDHRIIHVCYILNFNYSMGGVFLLTLQIIYSQINLRCFLFSTSSRMCADLK